RAGRHPDRRGRVLSRGGAGPQLLFLPAPSPAGKKSRGGPGPWHYFAGFGGGPPGVLPSYAETSPFRLSFAPAPPPGAPAARPTPRSTRPPDNTSSVATCSASSTGLCHGSTTTAVPRRIRVVQAAR